MRIRKPMHVSRKLAKEFKPYLIIIAIARRKTNKNLKLGKTKVVARTYVVSCIS